MVNLSAQNEFCAEPCQKQYYRCRKVCNAKCPQHGLRSPCRKEWKKCHRLCDKAFEDCERLFCEEK